MSLKICKNSFIKPLCILFFLVLSQILFSQTENFIVEGHRGARGLFAENTIEGFKQTLKLGVHILEMDVVISKDMKVVVSHDQWLKKSICNNVNGAKKKYYIFSMDYNEVRSYDCGSKLNKKFPLQKNFVAPKPLLSELFDSLEQFAKRENIPLPYYNIEIKSTKKGDNKKHPKVEVYTKLVYDEITKHHVESRTNIQSFDTRPLEIIKQLNPNLSIALLSLNIGGAKKKLNSLSFKPNTYSPLYIFINKHTVAYCHNNGIGIIPWTVNSTKKMLKMKKLGCNGIITDYPNIALKI